ncbi:hypothetical protein OP10G_4267 [Fimbriimonas ginsengisoli Gsoil 348]|uniref:Uncharacterized protein n=1 Tax=Fimbriimonas ginsengisoli Gsoil 348 TaxID=661478 RepID=A0A068NXW7_FIMGI|nr:hypothetical protein OP10G_4267 [Fimbriimonas ginsengisoli Gsoil 348]
MGGIFALVFTRAIGEALSFIGWVPMLLVMNFSKELPRSGGF